MKKTLLTLSIALTSLFAANAFAQKDVPGEGRAVQSAPATPAEKAAAKTSRKSEGAVASKTHSTGDAQPAGMGKAKVTPASDKTAAKYKRKAEGAEAVKGPKEPN
jgi:hypothetical protein